MFWAPGLLVPSAATATLVVLTDVLPGLHLRHRPSVTTRGLLLLLVRIATEVGFAWLGLLVINQSVSALEGLAQAGGAALTGLATSSLLRSQAVEVAGLRFGLGPLYDRWTEFLDRHLRDISAESQSREIRRFTEEFLNHGVSLQNALHHRILDHIAHNASLQDSQKWERTEIINGTLGDGASPQKEKIRAIVGHALKWGMHRTLREVMVEAKGTFWRRTWDRIRNPRGRVR